MLMAEEKVTVCRLLKEVADALFYIGEEARPKGVYWQKYAELYRKVAELMKDIGCPEARQRG